MGYLNPRRADSEPIQLSNCPSSPNFGAMEPLKKYLLVNLSPAALTISPGCWPAYRRCAEKIIHRKGSIDSRAILRMRLDVGNQDRYAKSFKARYSYKTVSSRFLEVRLWSSPPDVFEGRSMCQRCKLIPPQTTIFLHLIRCYETMEAWSFDLLVTTACDIGDDCLPSRLLGP